MSNFFSMIFRMKYINRWGLMRNSYAENLSQHSFEVALIAHALAVISTRRLNIEADAEKLVMAALYHDACEIITGDMPTPVKYHGEQIKNAYKTVEKQASMRLLSMLPEDLRPDFQPLIFPELSGYENILLKAADKIAALIKCIEEENAGNTEFVAAKKSQSRKLKEMECAAVDIFLEEFLPGFKKSLDEQYKI